MIIPVLGNLQMLLLLQTAVHTYVPPVCGCSYMKQYCLLQYQRKQVLHLARPPCLSPKVCMSAALLWTQLRLQLGFQKTAQASAGGNPVVMGLNMVSNKDMR